MRGLQGLPPCPCPSSLPASWTCLSCRPNKHPLPLLPPSFLDVSELLSVAGRLRRDTDMEEARAMLTNMDVDHDGRVDLTEYTQLLEQLVSVP